MLKTRVMPCLLLDGRRLVKTIKFKDAQYIGDPINTVRIFNEKEVDELIFLDIGATPENRDPPYQLIEEIASECFMPFAYGGGIRDVEQIKRVFSIGVEKVVINTNAVENNALVKEASQRFGSQSIIVSIDARRSRLGGYRVWTHGVRNRTKVLPEDAAVDMEKSGAGEILITSMDRDGTFEGYDIDLLKRVAKAVHVPVVACGGAGGVEDFATAVKEGGASAVAAGSMVVYQGKARGVLVNFPSKQDLQRVLG